jgi:hypothetical protein
MRYIDRESFQCFLANTVEKGKQAMVRFKPHITQTVTNAIEQLTRSMQILKLNVASLVTGTNAFLVS